MSSVQSDVSAAMFYWSVNASIAKLTSRLMVSPVYSDDICHRRYKKAAVLFFFWNFNGVCLQPTGAQMTGYIQCQ